MVDRFKRDVRYDKNRRHLLMVNWESGVYHTEKLFYFFNHLAQYDGPPIIMVGLPTTMVDISYQYTFVEQLQDFSLEDIEVSLSRYMRNIGSQSDPHALAESIMALARVADRDEPLNSAVSRLTRSVMERLVLSE